MVAYPTPGLNAALIETNSLITPQRPIAYSAVVTTANTNYTDTPTNTVQIIPGLTQGARITKVTALTRATLAAAEVQLFTSIDSGTTKKFIDSALLAATVSQTTRQVKATFGFSESEPLILAANESLWVATGVTTTGIVVRAEGGAYV